jgi:hypothetical protein
VPLVITVEMGYNVSMMRCKSPERVQRRAHLAAPVVVRLLARLPRAPLEIVRRPVVLGSSQPLANTPRRFLSYAPRDQLAAGLQNRVLPNNFPGKTSYTLYEIIVRAETLRRCQSGQALRIVRVGGMGVCKKKPRGVK